MTTETSSDPVEQRSEIVFFFDTRNNNPNGDPQSGNNSPRIDSETGHCYVTDVRLKRYIRDQLQEDGHGIFVQRMEHENGDVFTREELIQERLNEINLDELDESEIKEAVLGEFLEESTDVRYFGATLSIDSSNDNLLSALPNNFTGAVQFAPGVSLHPVTKNEEFNSLTSVIATQSGKGNGGYELDDERIRYGLIGFNGIVNENAADDTNLTQEDVERLDTLLWRAMKNQTMTRSKMGQNPRFYMRVEYAQDGFHIGGLDDTFQLNSEKSEQYEQIRRINDIVVDLSETLRQLNDAKNRIDSFNIVVDESITFSATFDGEEYYSDEFDSNKEFLTEVIETVVPNADIGILDPYEDALATA